MVEVKGAAVKSMPKYIVKKFGKDGLNQWLDKISYEAYSVYTSHIKTKDWYPMKTVLIEPTANIAQLFFNWDLKRAAWDCGRYSADFGLKGVYRVFIKMGSPKFLIDKASEILPTYYKPSSIKVKNYQDGDVTVHITKFPEIDKTIEYRIGGWMQRALEICGCKKVQVAITKSLTNHNSFTEYKLKWLVKK
jgi:hypothetical protein